MLFAARRTPEVDDLVARARTLVPDAMRTLPTGDDAARLAGTRRRIECG